MSIIILHLDKAHVDCLFLRPPAFLLILWFVVTVSLFVLYNQLCMKKCFNCDVERLWFCRKILCEFEIIVL